MGCGDDSWVPGVRLEGGKDSLNARGSQPRRWWCPNVREKNHMLQEHPEGRFDSSLGRPDKSLGDVQFLHDIWEAGKMARGMFQTERQQVEGADGGYASCSSKFGVL